MARYELHCSLSQRSFPRWQILAAAVVAIFVSFSAKPVAAYCRSTTCSGNCPLDVDGCKTTGTPLEWPGNCAGFSLQKDASEHIPLEVARPVVERAFATWSNLDCGSGISPFTFGPIADVACHSAGYNPDGNNANIIMFPHQGSK